MRLLSLIPAVAGLVATGAAISTIEVVGNKFFDQSGNQFFIKGIAYQLTPDDPLTDAAQCTLDAALMKSIGTNTIRVYHVDPTADHSGCMAAFESAGIYALIDLDTFSTYILPNNPWWNQTQLNHYSQVMDSFIQYDNLLGFFIGNEVIALNNQSNAAPYIKAATRDIKAYRNSKKYRDVPIGYSAADIAQLRPMLQDYLTCGGNTSENIDFYGLNSYEWCSPSNNYQTSGYATLESMAVNFPVPIFLSETGCNTPGPRVFDDQDAIFSSPMVNDWSGAIIYEWIEEANNYGLVSYGPQVAATVTDAGVYDGYTRSGTPLPVSPDFPNLSAKWATITPSGVARSAYDASSVSTRACPTATPSGWLVDGNVKLPTLGETFAGTYTPSPSATGSAASPTSSNHGGASGDKHFAAMSAGLASVMLLFTVWL